MKHWLMVTVVTNTACTVKMTSFSWTGLIPRGCSDRYSSCQPSKTFSAWCSTLQSCEEMYFSVWPNLYISKNTGGKKRRKEKAKSATKMNPFWVTSFSGHSDLINCRLEHTTGWKNAYFNSTVQKVMHVLYCLTKISFLFNLLSARSCFRKLNNNNI